MSKAPLYRTKTTYIIYASLEDNAKYNPPQQTTAFKKPFISKFLIHRLFRRKMKERIKIKKS
ncbi:hypothetical protein DW785_06730 [Bacteroides xylanisolvens]|jgi:hypothetical protein|nr:hypothetical protein B5E50_17255 [Bacteroides xylanisolvens]RHD68766.1 hypothetical protein DW785_06730 [Bacteroides xylanisolvens]